MKKLMSIVVIMGSILAFQVAHAGFLVPLTGRLVGIEKHQAILKTKTGEVRIPMKKLSAENAKVIRDNSGSKKEITLRLPAQTFMD